MISRHRDLTVFLLVAFGLSWLVALPLWLPSRPAPITPVALAMMFTPAAGVLAVWRVCHRQVPFRRWARDTGLALGGRRGLRLVVLAWAGTALLTVLAIAVSAATGLLSLDLANLGLLRRQLAQATGGAPPVEPGVILAVQVALGLVAPLVNAIPALGEEYGWRGWLLPRLLPLGPVRAIAVSGLIWGAWHAPLTLRGYNYPELGPWAALMFTGFCVLFGAFLGWTRLASGSVWPAVAGHATLNAVGGWMLLVGDAAHPPSPVIAGITGLPGWALLAVVALVLARRSRECRAGVPAASAA
ncbi:abortive infection protein [Sphaerisporangium rufum]|uniref:Abortive infection protein n=1 Tax=Sphaerisporangium rufum TaxID=1381558 RepID=A0A919QXP0_9ACTN|nr:CPBP family intramembrane glutamic endopeptidase [Sphaerisporangium rufum]GII76026.1 abortive infection protein [Sphaerisporangium rufum]